MADRSSKPKRPRDPNVRAKLIVDIATGEIEESGVSVAHPEKRKSGSMGGRSRAQKLTPVERSEIARRAAKIRWEKAK